VDAIERMRVEETERRLAARLLHDCLCTDLTNLTLAVEIALRTFDADPARGKEALHRVREAAIACNSTARFARLGPWRAPRNPQPSRPAWALDPV
jgi:signal transduction histidine kinase